MQPPVDPIVAVLIISLVAAIFIIIIIVIKYYMKTRKPYQFTDDITDLNKLINVTPIIQREESQSVAPQLAPISMPSFPTKLPKESD